MTRKIEIIPAILPADWAELTEKLELISGATRSVQIDVCDGRFVPSFTWPYRKHDDNFDRLVKQEEGLPGWESLNYEFDLMVNEPHDAVEDWIQAGASRLVLHAESKGFDRDLLIELAGRVELGLALNETTPIDTIGTYRENIQFIQLMGIDRIGYQSQPFDERVIGRVKEVRLKYPGLPISVDGGVTLENARSLIDAGCDRLVIGSSIFAAENPIEAVRRFAGLA